MWIPELYRGGLLVPYATFGCESPGSPGSLVVGQLESSSLRIERRTIVRDESGARENSAFLVGGTAPYESPRERPHQMSIRVMHERLPVILGVLSVSKR